MNTPDWSKAPEGATHWGPENDQWYESWIKNDGNKFMVWFDTEWRQDLSVGSLRRSQLIPRPAQWRGPQDGLPPAGTVCEYRLGNGNWFKCEIISHNRLVIKCPHLETDNGEGLQILGDHEAKFRPIQSDRDRAIEQMRHIAESAADKIQHVDAGSSSIEKERAIMGALYDAGYRKP